MAYDIRGIYPTELSDKDAYKIGLAYANLMRAKGWIKTGKVVVGHDMRKSSPILKQNLVEGITDGGLDVIDIGMVPTPVFYFAVSHGFDGGVMVTASHNPPEYNGFKIQREKALPITGETGIYEMRDMIFSDKLKKYDKGSIEEKDFKKEYVDYLSKKANFSSLKIVIDNGNGAFGFIPEEILRNYSCEVKTLYGEPDGTFPNHPADPHKHETLKDLQNEVSKSGADVGFAFDGDGDRLGVVDEKGRIVPSDFVLMMLAREALSKKKGVVVVDTRATMALLEDIEKHGGIPFMWKCGHAYILEKIFEKDAVFGGEITGHMYFPLEYYPYDDGMFIALKMAELVYKLKSKGLTLSEYVDTLPRYFATKEYIFPCPNEKKFEVINSIVEEVKKNKDKYGLDKVIDIDGVRIETKEAWGIVRASNTGPKIKCRFEGKTKTSVEHVKSLIFGLLKNQGVEVEE